jgi:hypothetical protein
MVVLYMMHHWVPRRHAPPCIARVSLKKVASLVVWMAVLFCHLFGPLSVPPLYRVPVAALQDQIVLWVTIAMSKYISIHPFGTVSRHQGISIDLGTGCQCSLEAALTKVGNNQCSSGKKVLSHDARSRKFAGDTAIGIATRLLHVQFTVIEVTVTVGSASKIGTVSVHCVTRSAWKDGQFQILFRFK